MERLYSLCGPRHCVSVDHTLLSQQTSKLASLAPFPELGDQDLDDNASNHDCPFPGNRTVVEDVHIQAGNVDQRKEDEKARDTRPEEEPVLIDGGEDGEDLAGRCVV